MLSSEIRSLFLKFFENNSHKVVESSPLIPQSDPSLLFTNSGMVQFKNVFTGLETREYKRATSSQKCIRAGGKHNDLDQVGFTARHHTFFEMLGNFSFGDYFKDDAINFAWTFLTKELGISKSKLLVTVFHTDEEALKIWKKVAGDITIIPISTNDNFWSMGDVGPCGPCSEIFYDHGPEIFGGMPGTPDESGDRYTEIWNIVFMQFEQKSGNERIPLQKKSIDTGMGLERIAAVIQGVHDNYESDLFRHIISNIKEISKTNYETTYPSYKVIADHIRSVTFLIADGVVPSNEGRGYVLRRILRRAMRHGNLINISDPFLFRLSDTLVESMKVAYPELEKVKAVIASTIKNEEEKFLDTLERGLKILKNDIKGIAAGGILGGDIAFKLYDTYGFPLDLTQDILKSEKISVDIEGFDKHLQEQRNRAKWAGSGESREDKVWHALKEKLKATDFCGYDQNSLSSKILGIVKNGEEVGSLHRSCCQDSDFSQNKAFLITESTPFYAECGGQCGDIGSIETEKGKFIVTNTLKFCDSIIAHAGEVVDGDFNVSDIVSLKIDEEKRRKIKANHTATHLLQSALRLVLGEHVAQRGSFLNDERLRFDFSHNSSLSADEISNIEAIVNNWVSKNFPVNCETLSKSEAMSSGATALFGEKYGDHVRTIRICQNCQSGNCKDVVSFELCGGTHVSSTSEIGLFKIISECSIGSGIRRIEAITGQSVLQYLNDIENTLNSVSEKLNCNSGEIPYKIGNMMLELKEKNQQILSYKQQVAISCLQQTEKNGVMVFSVIVDDYSVDELRSLLEIVRSKNSSGIILIISKSSDSDRISMVVGVSSDLQMKYNAGLILKESIAFFGGKGGGNASFAQGGGVGKSNAYNSLQKIIEGLF